MKSFAFAAIVGVAFAGTVKIMSFNIDCRFCDFHHENGASWHARVKNEHDTMARHNPDLIGIQEPIFKYDVQQLLPKGYKALFWDQADWVPWGAYPDATIFYREDRFIVRDFQKFWLGPNPNLPIGFDTLSGIPRIAVYALLEDTSDNTLFYFGSTHFDHGDNLEGRNKDCTASAKELLSFTEPLAAKYPFLWVGDFNSETENNNAYSILTNTTSSFHLVDTYFKSPTHKVVSNVDPVPDYNYGHSIDHIFFANNDNVAEYSPLDWSVDMYKYGDKQ